MIKSTVLTFKVRDSNTRGCSPVRLGISKEKSATYSHNREEYGFCCQPFADLFSTDYLQETKDLIVCSTCLGEKPPPSTAMLRASTTRRWKVSFFQRSRDGPPRKAFAIVSMLRGSSTRVDSMQTSN